MLHLIDGLVIFLLVEFLEAPVLVHACMQKILVDGGELVFQRVVEELYDLGITFHGGLLD